LKAFLLSIVTAFFEPLLKIYIVTAVGIASVPTFELLIRVISAARNGLVVFLQTYTSKLVDVGRSASETVKTLDWVAALTMFFALGAGERWFRESAQAR